MAKRIVTKIGDIFCVEVDNAYKRYFQYFCNDMSQLNSSVIRVFKKRYPMDSNPKPEAIVSDEVDFYAHTILRAGIETGSWYKTGHLKCDFEEETGKPLFGTCEDIVFDGDEIIDDIPDPNWYIWKINQKEEKMERLPERYRDVVEQGSVFPYIEILDRIRYGYYRYTSSENEMLKRIPHPDTNSYVRRKEDHITVYLHFKGEDVIQKIEVDDNGDAGIEEGNPLPLPKFWETNWKYSEFITAEEFKSVWDRYALNQ